MNDDVYERAADMARRGRDWGSPPTAANGLRKHFIVIDRADLPEVTVDSDGDVSVRGEATRNPSADPAGVESLAYALLAIAAHLREHPPVDAKQVAAIRRALSAETGEPTALTRGVNLYRAGVRVDVKS